jgi:asparagine N-glycosylation enzyme membrane subunit Stt3
MTFTEGPTYERSDVFVQPPMPAMVETPVVASPVNQVMVPVTPVAAGQVRTAYASRFAPDAVIAALAGLVLLVVGLIAMVRGGFDGPMSIPVVSVLGFTHTTTLGVLETAIGLCLLLSGAARSRTGGVFFGAILGIAAFVGAVQTNSFKKSLALESGWAWLMVFAAVIVVLSALVMPRFARNSTTIANI